MPASPSRILLDPMPPTRLLRDLIACVEQLVVQHQERELQGRFPIISPSATVPHYSQCLVVLNELARRSRSPNKYPSPRRGKKISAIVYCRLKSRLDIFTRSLSPPTFEPIPSRRNSDRSNNYTLCEPLIGIAGSLHWRQCSPIATGPIWLTTSVRLKINNRLHCDMISSGE